MATRKILLAGLIVTLFALLLSGCSALIERHVLDVRPHVPSPASDFDADDAIVIMSRGELRQTIWGMLEERVEHRLFRIHNIDIDDVRDVLHEVSLEPLAAYAISVSMPHILVERPGLLEIELTIDYQKTAEQISGVRFVRDAELARVALGRMLREGQTYLAMLSPANIANISLLEDIILSYYYSAALNVVILPEIHITLYGSGNQRIAAVELDFGVDPAAFSQMHTDLHTAADVLLEEMPHNLTIPQQIIWLAENLAAHVNKIEPPHTEEAPALWRTAYGALVLHDASSEGFARGMQALLSLLDIETIVLRGERDEVFHAWNLVNIDGHYYHIDISMLALLDASEVLFVSDELMMFQNGYSWDVSLYPRADGILNYFDFLE